MNDYKDLAERMLNALQSDQGINEEAGVLMIHAVNAIQALQARLEVTENAPDGIACRDMTIEMLEKRIEELEAERNAWRNAVIDELVTLNIACKKHEYDPKFAVRDCINYNVQLALDPAISSQAQELIDRGRAEERAEREKQKPVAWEGAEQWEPLAMFLCADENGPDSCHEMVWEGYPPEPWGERWQKYESEARRMIDLTSYAFQRATAPVKLTEKQIYEMAEDDCFLGNVKEIARAVEDVVLRANGFKVDSQ